MISVVSLFVPYVISALKRQEKESDDPSTKQHIERSARIVASLSRKQSWKLVRVHEGQISALGDDLFDAIFDVSGKRIGIAIFRSSLALNGIKLFVAKAANELRGNGVERVVIVFFVGERDEELRRAALGQLPLYISAVRKGFQIVVLDASRLDDAISTVTEAN